MCWGVNQCSRCSLIRSEVEVKSGQNRCVFVCVHICKFSCVSVCVRLGLFVWVRDPAHVQWVIDVEHRYSRTGLRADTVSLRALRHHWSLSLLRLIQLNTVNNWSDGETEARPHGMRMTSWVKAMETDTVSGDWSSCVLSSKNTSDCLTRTVNRSNRDDNMASAQKWSKSWSELRTEHSVWFLSTCSGLILTDWKQCHQCGFDGHTVSFITKII